MRKINIIDLFAGCGGLMEGFEQNGHFSTLACVEWEKAPCENLRNRLYSKWNHQNANDEVIRFDIRRTQELFKGFNDPVYGVHGGLDNLVKCHHIDTIIGGPPCQAYSIAGRIRDKNSMKNDYRNYLFESYVDVVDHYKPEFFVFENVQGILSAAPNNYPITERIKESFAEIGYVILDDLTQALFDLSEFGIPQRRKRVILLGVRKESFPQNYKEIIYDFYYTLMPSKKRDKTTVYDTISKYPPLYPLDEPSQSGKRQSHTNSNSSIYFNHEPRYHNKRDIKIFKLLANDIKSGEELYNNTQTLKKLYTDMTGKHSNIHKYYVLRASQQSNTIPAHLYKDGLRHIHPDPTQARSITVREAAALQTFPDDFIFSGSMMNQYKMIGNAVPPSFSKIIADCVEKLFDKYGIKHHNR